LRTADAANLDAVLIANQKWFVQSKHSAIQRWMFVTNQIATGTTSEIIAFLKERKINFIVLLYKTLLHTTRKITLLQRH
jgi:TrmH family RNA methyltransferase